ncbi:MAG: hypothetical protein ACMG57_00945 [Candidatus Dojkabacteria bacterium]
MQDNSDIPDDGIKTEGFDGEKEEILRIADIISEYCEEKEADAFIGWAMSGYDDRYFDNPMLDMDPSGLIETFIAYPQLKYILDRLVELCDRRTNQNRKTMNYVRWRGGNIWMNFWTEMVQTDMFVIPSLRFTAVLDLFIDEQKPIIEKWFRENFDLRVLRPIVSDPLLKKNLSKAFNMLGLDGWHPIYGLLASLDKDLNRMGHRIDEYKGGNEEERKKRRRQVFRRLHKGLVKIDDLES